MRNIIIPIVIFIFFVSCEENNNEFDKKIIKKETFDNDSLWELEKIDPAGNSIIEIINGYLTLKIINSMTGIYFLSASTNDSILIKSYKRFGLILKMEKGKFHHYSDGILNTNYGVQFSFCYGNIDIVIPKCNLLEPHNIEILEGKEYEIKYDNGEVEFLIDGIKNNSNLIKATVGGSVYCNKININLESKGVNDLSKEIELIFDEIEFYTW